MTIIPGHALLLQIPYFADGEPGQYSRPFLVIGANQDLVQLFNVSSISGKEARLVFFENKIIKNFDPPFQKPSFVKLNAVYQIERFSNLEKSIMCGGRTLDRKEMSDIIVAGKTYSKNNRIKRINFTKEDILSLNAYIA
jgi:hypothetical protein